MAQNSSISVYRYIWTYFAKVKGMFFCTLAFIVIGEICRQTGFYYASRIAGVMTDGGEKTAQIHQAAYYVTLMGIFMFARAVFVNVKVLFVARFLPRLRVFLTRDLFHQAHCHDLQFFHEEMSGRVAAKINQIVEEILHAYNLFEAPFVSLLRLMVGFYFLVCIHWTMGVALIIVTIVYVFFVWLISQRLVSISENAHNKKSLVTGVMTDTLFNYAILKNDGNIRRENLYLVQYLNPWIRAERRIYYTEFILYVSQGLFRGILQAVFLSIPLVLWLHHHISVADFVLSESLITYLILFALNMGGKVSHFFRSMGGLQDGLNFIFQPIRVKDKEKATSVCLKTGAVAFEDVCFSYPQAKEKAPLFQNFNLRINAGDKVGLVGASGSGKSTLIKLICRYYDIDSGVIRLNDTPICALKQESLRQQIAMIEQNPSLFNRSILENIRYGRLDANDEEVIEAAKKAYIHDVIMRLPNGYHTKVGERGVVLSGGERQRIAIARAILKEAPILILDEATSALDSESELFIQKALEQLMQQKTVIAIAHRLSTLRKMDYLLVMQKGKIIEKGAHSDLLKKNGAYAHFYRLQTKGFKEESQ